MEVMRFDLDNPTGYDAEIGLLYSLLEDSTREWREELGEVSDDDVVWQPYPDGPSVASEILHIAEVETWWLETVALGTPENMDEAKELMSAQIRQYEGLWPTIPPTPLSYFLGLHDRVRARISSALRTYSAPKEHMTFHDGKAEATQRWMLGHVIQHDSYHGGQAVMLAQLAQRLRG